MSTVMSSKPSSGLLKAALLLAAMVIAAYMGHSMKATLILADTLPTVNFDTDIPAKFGPWRVDASIAPVLPDPTQQEFLNKLYNATFSKTYVDSNGERIMFTAAYGKVQADDTLQLHNPEICYSAQGFLISDLHPSVLTVSGRPHHVHQMLATARERSEVVTYWVVIGEKNANTRTQQKIARLTYAMKGFLSDGLLMRVSSIDKDTTHAYAMHEKFINDLAMQFPDRTRPRYLGQ